MFLLWSEKKNIDKESELEIEFSYMYILYNLLKELDNTIKEGEIEELLEKKYKNIILKEEKKKL